MRKYRNCFAACAFGLASLLGLSQPSSAQKIPLTAVDIALEPDATMFERAHAANARLLEVFPKGFALDETHNPHVTMLQQFVRTADLDKVYAVVNEVMAKEKPATWKLKAYKYYYIPSPPIGLAGIVVEPTEDLCRLQKELIDAVTPYTEKHGTPAAFYSAEDGRDIQKFLIEYVGYFTTIAAGKKFNPACHDWHWHGSLSEQNAQGAVRHLRVLARRRLGLPARQFWHGAQGTQGADAKSLRSRKAESKHVERLRQSLGPLEPIPLRCEKRPSRDNP